VQEVYLQMPCLEKGFARGGECNGEEVVAALRHEGEVNRKSTIPERDGRWMGIGQTMRGNESFRVEGSWSQIAVPFETVELASLIGSLS
jgi:hypothetical protein